jgi:hypothetical protein
MHRTAVLYTEVSIANVASSAVSALPIDLVTDRVRCAAVTSHHWILCVCVYVALKRDGTYFSPVVER